MKENNKGVIILLSIIIVVLAVLCVLFAMNIIKFNSNENVTTNSIDKNEEKTGEEIVKLNSNENIVVTRNGKIISNSIPDDLIGIYYNQGAKDNDYFRLDNDDILISNPNCSGGSLVYAKEQVKLFINYLDVVGEDNQHITLSFLINSEEYEKNVTYVYIGESILGNDFVFKTIDPTCSGGEGINNNFPYKK